MNGDRRDHWQRVDGEKKPTKVSWYQPVPEKSLQLIRATGIGLDDPILDAGGGASTLVDYLIDQGYTDISVLDISGRMLDRARCRLGDPCRNVTWIESDVVEFRPSRRYALWHDRAVFHFLTAASERDSYVNVVRQALRSKGFFVLATFGPQGPMRCSGLDTRRYSIEELQVLFASTFKLCSHELQQHETPQGSTQQFLYSCWQSSS